jgi:hypothetical protein
VKAAQRAEKVLDQAIEKFGTRHLTPCLYHSSPQSRGGVEGGKITDSSQIRLLFSNATVSLVDNMGEADFAVLRQKRLEAMKKKQVPPASCLLPLAACLLPLASFRSPLASCLLPLATCLLLLATCLLPLASCKSYLAVC